MYDTDKRHTYYAAKHPQSKRVPKLTEEEKALILSMRANGASLSEISYKTERPLMTIWRFLKKYNQINK